jgi:two-component system, cell cycle response regulator
MSGHTVGERLSVLGNVFIGRDPSAQLVLQDAGVSYRHACLEDRGDAWVLVDLGSTNGTKVNGERAKEAPLKHGDRLHFGSTVVRFELQDETDQAYSEAIYLLVHTDDLTGLLLRRRFDAELTLLLNQAAAVGTPLSLLAMDLDGIKAINDQHGHLFGAYTIAETGKLIGKMLPEDGIACRFGGDEFIVALMGHDLNSAREIAERFRVAVSQHPYNFQKIPLRPSLSIGVAQFPKHAEDAEALFRAADAALYAAKRNGKNCVECASDAAVSTQ